jgi:hypothetical protein
MHEATFFSFGCVLQETITGTSPFVRATRAETVSAILTETAPSLKQFDPTIPAELDQAVKRRLNKEPDQRFQAAGDLAFHLRQILNTDSSASARMQLTRWVARITGRTAQTAAAVVVVLLFLGAFGYWFGEGGPPLCARCSSPLPSFLCRIILAIRSRNILPTA